MFQIMLGAIFGFFFGFVFFVIVIIEDLTSHFAILTSVVVAFATVFATLIHFNAIKQQRKDRLWDINKSVLLGLSEALSQVIKIEEYYLQDEYAKRHLDDPPDDDELDGAKIFKDFYHKREYALNVYQPLMDKELISELLSARSIDEGIEMGLREFNIDIIQAYEDSIAKNEELKRKLNRFIAKTAGVFDC